MSKKLKKLVPNWNNNKATLVSSGKVLIITFIYRGSLRKLELVNEDWSLKCWAEHLVQYFDTGKFPMVSYWELYSSEKNKNNPNALDRTVIATLPSKLTFKNGVVTEHGKIFSKFMKINREKYGDCGFTLVGIPQK